MLMQVSGPVNAAPRAVMWSIKQIAERDGVSRPAISQAVSRLVKQHGLTVERDGQGRVSAVNVAEFDHLRGQYRDPTKDQRPEPPAPAAGPSSESFDEASRQKEWLAVERAKITLAETKGELISAAGVANALVNAGADIARILDRLVNATDDLANAVAREGVHGLRVALKKQAGRMRTEIADALAKVATDAPAEETAEPEAAVDQADA